MKLSGRFAGFSLAMAMLLALGANVSLAQPGGFRGRGGPGGPGGPGGFFGGGGTLGLIQQQEVQQEIELSEDQLSELRTMGEEIREQIGNEMRDMFEGMRGLSNEERQARGEEIRARFEQITKDAEGRMQKVLMPHQFDRLKQIDVQSRLQRGGAGALTEGELADTLGLTEAQRDQLREKQEEIQKDLDAKIGQLRVEARNQLLEVLTPEQRAKLTGLMGADFALPEPRFGPPLGGRGGRGIGGREGRGGRGGERGDRGGRAVETQDRST